MSVVAFERRQAAGVWTEAELNIILAALHSALAPSTGRSWEAGAIEEKFEPILGKGEESLVQVAPQLAAFA